MIRCHWRQRSYRTNCEVALMALNDGLALRADSSSSLKEKGQANILWVHKSLIHCQWSKDFFCSMMASDFSPASLVSGFVKESLQVSQINEDHTCADVSGCTKEKNGKKNVLFLASIVQEKCCACRGFREIKQRRTMMNFTESLSHVWMQNC